jgi:hypothetical protein
MACSIAGLFGGGAQGEATMKQEIISQHDASKTIPTLITHLTSFAAPISVNKRLGIQAKCVMAAGSWFSLGVV